MTDLPDQSECTEFVVNNIPESAPIVANLGVASNVLGNVKDRDRNFYMSGGMGVTTPTGLGLAMSVDDTVVVLEGDGSLLMSLGCLSTVGEYDPENLVVVVWNNAIYATTGGQASASENVDFGMAAESCGVNGTHISNQVDFEDAFHEALEYDGASLVACDVERADPERAEIKNRATSAYLSSRFRQTYI